MDQRQHAGILEQTLVNRLRRTQPESNASSSSLPRSLYRAGQSVANDFRHGRADQSVGAARGISGPRNPRPIGRAVNRDSVVNQSHVGNGALTGQTPSGSPAPVNRTIRFPDDNPSVPNLSEQTEGRTD